MICDRRTALALAAAIFTAGPVNGVESATATRLILLGTAGGPRPRKARSGPAQAIVSGGSIYVIDCGYGVAHLPDAQELARSVLSHHTSAEQAGEVAAEAGVKMLVLSHLVPAEDPNVPDDEWIAAARRHYSGPIVVGRDLMEI